VLIVDLDPQATPRRASASTAGRSCSTYGVLIGEAPLRPWSDSGAAHIAASTMDLGLELELGATRDRAFRFAMS
jgi:hypothetical protein